MADLFEEFPELTKLDPDDVVEPEDMYQQYPFDNCWTVENVTLTPSVQDVAAALILTRGVLIDAARLLKRNRSSLENFIVRDHRLKSLQENTKESFLDRIENMYMTSALAGDPVAQRFFLTTLAKSRGYSTRTESTGADGKDLIPATLSAEAISSLSPEVMEALLNAQDLEAAKPQGGTS